jgi:CRISPR-associated endoribonuclease Cas6
MADRLEATVQDTASIGACSSIQRARQRISRRDSTAHSEAARPAATRHGAAGATRPHAIVVGGDAHPIDPRDGLTFFRRLIRRIGTLIECYCSIRPDEPRSDYSALAALADKVVVAEQNVSLQTWERFSSSIDAKHPLSGLVGTGRLTNIAEPLWPYLILGRWVHVGKSASFGQGRYEVLPQQDTLTQRATALYLSMDDNRNRARQCSIFEVDFLA